jgi:pimeloyl-ACP methyl ester carboxylesterase
MLPSLRRAAFRAYGTLFPKHAARWFERALLTPRPVAALAVPEPKVPHVTRRLPYGAGWIAVTEWGTGPAVLLIHGWGGRSGSFDAFIEPIVAAGCRAVTFDLPAHGRSHGRQTNVIECAGAALQVGHAVSPLAGIVTHSFGGPVSALAWRHGLRAERVVMLAPPQSIWSVSVPVGDWLGLPRHVSEGMMHRFARRLGITWDELRTDRLVAEMTAPLLVVHDEDDRKIPWSHGAAVARAAPQATLRTTTGLGHRDVLLEASVVADAVAFVTMGAERERKMA